jgi:hypothetical protein
MKAQTLVPALALAAALVAPPLAEAGSRHRPERGRRPQAHGYYDRRPSHGSYGYDSRYGHGSRYSYGSRYGYGSGYRPRRPYHRSQRYYAPPPVYYGYGYGYGGYGYGGYDAYDYGYCPPPPRHRPRRPRVSVWLGF